MSDRNKKPVGVGLAASDWLSIFRGAKAEVERLDAAKSAQGRATIIGNFLARMVDREVPIEVDGRTGKATLRVTPGRSRKRLYYFDVIFEDGQSEPDARPGDGREPVGGKAIDGKKPVRGDRKSEVEVRFSPIDRTPGSGLVPVGNEEAW